MRVGEIAVDGTRIRANASRDRNRGYESIVTEILAEAERVDREEDERYGQARGDELPEPLRTREGRRAALAAARERIERERAAAVEAGEEVIERIELGLDRDRFRARRMVVRRGCVKGGASSKRAANAKRCRSRRVVASGWSKRGAGSINSLRYEHSANREYERYRATAVDRLGRKLSDYNRPNPYRPPLVPEGKINVTDPDSREMRTQGQPNIQGYNAQAVVTEQQIVIAAEITTHSPDFGQLKGQSPSPGLLSPTLLLLPQGDSDGARPPSDRQLKRALIVPMHGTQRVRPSGASVDRRQASTSSAPP